MSHVLPAMLAALYLVPTSEPAMRGVATHYNPGVMEEAARNRGLSLDGFAGGVALNRRGDVGRTVWLRWGDLSVSGPFLVVDCAGRDVYEWRERNRRVVEVDAETAKSRGFFYVGPAPVTVLFYDPEPRVVRQEA